MLLALAMLVAPKVTAVIVQRQLEVEQLRFDLNECRISMMKMFEANDICVEDLRYVIWKENYRRGKRRTRYGGK